MLINHRTMSIRKKLSKEQKNSLDLRGIQISETPQKTDITTFSPDDYNYAQEITKN